MVLLGVLGYPRHLLSLPGPHAVGAVHARIGDDHSSCFANTFYPCGAGGVRQPYWRGPAIDSITSMIGVPRWLLAHLAKRGPAREGAPVLTPPTTQENGWPLVIFSHGTWGSCEMYTSLCRSLASFGFVVVALEHEDGSGCYATRRSGQVVKHTDPVVKGNAGERPSMLQHRMDELDHALKSVSAAAPRTGARAADDAATLGAILAACDRRQTALMGHSFGGATMARAAQTLTGRHAIACTVMLDTWLGALPSDAIAAAVPVPSLSIDSESWAASGGYHRSPMFAASRAAVAFVAPGTVHQSFSDSQLWAPSPLARRMAALGRAERRHRTHDAVARLASTFIRQCLTPPRLPPPADAPDAAGEARSEHVKRAAREEALLAQAGLDAVGTQEEPRALVSCHALPAL